MNEIFNVLYESCKTQKSNYELHLQVAEFAIKSSNPDFYKKTLMLLNEFITNNPSTQVEQLKEQIIQLTELIRSDDLSNNSYQLSEPSKISSVDDLIEDIFEEELDNNITMSDVVGMDLVKKQLQMNFFAPINEKNLAQTYGLNAGGGLILYGPPGCGKTFIAKAIAGELKAKFFQLSMHNIYDKYIGETEKKIHAFFEMARKASPAVIFIDEVDTVGGRRTSSHNHTINSTVSQFLQELDGVSSNNKQNYIIAASNRPWEIDPALKRPNRFDSLIFVSPPDEASRKQLFINNLSNVPAENINYDWCAKSTNLYSAADIVHIVKKATQLAYQQALIFNKTIPVNQTMLKETIAEVKPSTIEWFNLSRNVVEFANASGQYDELKNYLIKNKI